MPQWIAHAPASQPLHFCGHECARTTTGRSPDGVQLQYHSPPPISTRNGCYPTQLPADRATLPCRTSAGWVPHALIDQRNTPDAVVASSPLRAPPTVSHVHTGG